MCTQVMDLAFRKLALNIKLLPETITVKLIGKKVVSYFNEEFKVLYYPDNTSIRYLILTELKEPFDCIEGFNPESNKCLHSNGGRHFIVVKKDNIARSLTPQNDSQRERIITGFMLEHSLFLDCHERDIIAPAFTRYVNLLFYIKDYYLHRLDFSTFNDIPILKLRPPHLVRLSMLSYNPTENAMLVSCQLPKHGYDLYFLPKDIDPDNPSPALGESKRSQGSPAIWIASDAFAVLDVCKTIIFIKNLSNETVRKISIDIPIKNIFYTGNTGLLLLETDTSIQLWDVLQLQCIRSARISKVKHVIWNADMSLVAFLYRNKVSICTGKLNILSSITETTAVKSGVWDDSDVFIYTTAKHIKYALINGDHGIIRTFYLPIYLTKIKDNSIYYLQNVNHDWVFKELSIDAAEFRVKLAVVYRCYHEGLTKVPIELFKQSIIAYIQSKGYPEVALNFVKDEETRFALALECGNIEIATEAARKLDDKTCWKKLAEAALLQGNHQVVEMAYQRIKNFDKLAFLYLITGNLEKLRKMMKIAEIRKDTSAQFQIALFLGDASERVEMIKNCGQNSLAYLCAATHGLYDEAEDIKRTIKNSQQLPDPDPNAEFLQPPIPIEHCEDNWPLQLATMAATKVKVDNFTPPVDMNEDVIGETADRIRRRKIESRASR